MSNELNLLERSRAISDFYWFSKYVFGNADMQEGTHRELCDTLQALSRMRKRGQAKFLALMPRGTFKSSIATQSYPLWRALTNSDIRILLTNEKQDNSKQFLGSIKSCIEQNTYFQELFGDLKNDESGRPVRWNQDSVTLSSRVAHQLKEATFSIGSPTTTKTGMHYDLIVADDLVSEKTVTTVEQIRKTLTYFRQLLSLLEPNGQLVVIGTRYSYDDLYGHLTENNIPDKVLIKRAIQEDGTLFFPGFESVNSKGEIEHKGLDHKTLDEFKKILGPFMFGCQYLNEPTNADTAIFLEEDFRHIGNGPNEKRVPGCVTRFLLVDPARSTAQDADFSAFVIVALDVDSNIYVEYAYQARLKPSETIDLIFDLHKMYNFQKIGVEQVAMQTMVDWIMDRAKTKGSVFLPVYPVKTSTTTSKETRIRGIEPFYKQHRIYHAKNLFDLESQLLRFPNVVHDDLVDALSMLVRVAYPPVLAPGSTEEEVDRNVVRVNWEEIRQRGKPEDDMNEWNSDDAELMWE